MKKYCSLIILIVVELLFGQTYDKLLHKQYIDEDNGIKELNRTITQNYLDRKLFGSISAGDILVNGDKKVLFVLDDNWDRIVYGVQNSGEMKGFGNFGRGDGEFNRAQDIVVLNDGTIYVADTDNFRIVKLSYDLTAETISFVSTIDLAGWCPNKIAVNPNACGGNTLIYIATETHKLLLKYENGPLYRYPENFSGDGVIETGVIALDYYNPYLFTIDEFDKEIKLFTMNDVQTDNTSLLFHYVDIYPLPDDFPGAIDLAIHESINDVAYIIDKKSVLNMRILNASSSKIYIPHVEDKPGAKFFQLNAISLKHEYGDVFIGEKWDDSHGAYWYALGPEIQEFEHSMLDYENENEFEFTVPERSIITTKILKLNGDILTILTNNVTEHPGKKIEQFNEYYNNSYIPYNTYTYEITAKSAFPHEGVSDNNEPESVVSFDFEGGVLPTEGDIVCSSNYLIEGHTYTIKNYSNSVNYNPPPLYTDTWRHISSQYGSGGKVTDLSENSSPYIASLKTSTSIGGNSLSKTSTDNSVIDNVGVKLSFGGITTEEVTRGFSSNPSNPGVCPTLYINNKPYVNLLPESRNVAGFVEDRITIPSDILETDTLRLKIAESGNDITNFKSVNLILEDVEKGTNLVRLSSGLSYEYKSRINYSSKKIAKSSKNISADYQAGDTLFLSLNQSGNAIMSSTGHIIGDEVPINYCNYNGGGLQLESVYQVPPSGENIFIDSDYPRAYSFENNFYLKDTLSNNGVRDYILVFHVDYHLESLDIYYIEENTNALAKVSSKYDDYFRPKYHNISNNFVLNGKKIQSLLPGKQIDFVFNLPKLDDNYQRYAYLKVVGRYDPYKVNNLGESNSVPKVYYLSQNYPNPFNPSTKFRFGLPYNSDIKIAIFNILGQHIKTIDKKLKAGVHEIVWDGSNKNGNNVSSGLYIYQFEAKAIDNNKYNFSQFSKMILLR